MSMMSHRLLAFTAPLPVPFLISKSYNCPTAMLVNYLNVSGCNWLVDMMPLWRLVCSFTQALLYHTVALTEQPEWAELKVNFLLQLPTRHSRSGYTRGTKRKGRGTYDLDLFIVILAADTTSDIISGPRLCFTKERWPCSTDGHRLISMFAIRICSVLISGLPGAYITVLVASISETWGWSFIDRCVYSFTIVLYIMIL